MDYIGSKRRLLEYIELAISQIPEQIKVFCDLFSGTGSVALYFKNKYKYEVIANDIQYYSFIQLKALLENKKFPKFKKFINIENFIKILNNLEGKEGFIFNNYSPSNKNEYNRMYFTIENAKKIDAIRQEIEKFYKENLLLKTEYYFALYLLLDCVDKYSNTAVVYEAYLKEFKNSSLKSIEIKIPENLSFFDTKTKIYNEDALKLIEKIEGNLLYLDPPYNSRQYSRNYHMLETLMRYDNPEIKGKAGVRKDSFISTLSQKRSALNDMEKIIKKAKFKYILISYSNEGIINFNSFKEMLEKYGTLNITEIDYSRFKSHSRNTKAKRVIEYLMLLKKEK